MNKCTPRIMTFKPLPSTIEGERYLLGYWLRKYHVHIHILNSSLKNTISTYFSKRPRLGSEILNSTMRSD